MQACPICRASLNGASVCRRCRAELGKVLEIEQRGRMLAVTAMRMLVEGDARSAVRWLGRARSGTRHPDGSDTGTAGTCCGSGGADRIAGVPYGIRTRVTNVKGWCPGPLDERDAGAPLGWPRPRAGVGSGPPRQGQGGGTGADTAIKWLPGRCRLRHAEQTTGWASGMKAALVSAVTTIVPMLLGVAPALAANIFVANQDPTAQIPIHRPAATPLGSIPSPTSSAVCTSPRGEPATITVTGAAGKVGRPEVYAVALLGTCYLAPDGGRQTGTALATAFTDPDAKDMTLRLTTLAYAPPSATNLVVVRAPDGASVFSGPADDRSASRVPTSLADINNADSGRAAGSSSPSAMTWQPAIPVLGSSAIRMPHTGAMSVTVAKFGDYGTTSPALDRFRSTDGDRSQTADGWASHSASEPSSVFIMQPDTNLVLPADDFAWHVGGAAQTPNPNSIGSGARPSLSATVSRHGASPSYANVLAAIP